MYRSLLLVGEGIVLPIMPCSTITNGSVVYVVNAKSISICTISPFIPIPVALLVAKTVLSTIFLRLYVKLVPRDSGLPV
jgi:hypothetical protein